MTSRKLPSIIDNSHQTASKLLYTTVHDAFGQGLHPFDAKHQLMRGYHLVYFPPNTPLSSLLPDGTDPLHSPGPPFNRRMWAGGEIFFNETIPLGGKERALTCHEHVEGIEVKSKAGREMVFVTINRRIMMGEETRDVGLKAAIVEKRKLVFMEDRPQPIDAPGGQPSNREIVRSPYEATVARALTPSPGLLFRFSALTFNAHRIHLDQAYCRDVEGHRNLLVHGPLSLVLMLHLLQSHLKSAGAPTAYGKQPDIIVHVEYQCLAPLYAEEELKVCLSRKSQYVWKTWIEGPDGGLAVRGTVTTAEAG
ncbi:MAG: hypothetical protein L6R41_007903 [Letrouitia leprolyta]|nr:MAG: hypothetical protein L6R41_007903 [Letrouitia leprolyta]